MAAAGGGTYIHLTNSKVREAPMKVLRNLVVLLGLLPAAAATWAQAAPGADKPAEEETCTFDTAHYRQKAQALAKAKKGSEIDLSTYTVTWPDARYGRVSVRIGGCSHFGMSVSASRKAAGPLRQREATALAQRLVREFLPKGYAYAANDLNRRSTERRPIENGMFYNIVRDGIYTDVEVTSTFEKGRSTVTVKVIPEA